MAARAKKPPPADLVGECSVLADFIELGEIDLTAPVSTYHPDLSEDEKLLRRVHEIQLLAISEYLRRFPWTRNMNNQAWIDEVHQHDDPRFPHEREIFCFFCRKSLNSIDARRSLTAPLLASVHEHTIECAVRMMAGLVTPKAPPRPKKKGHRR